MICPPTIIDIGTDEDAGSWLEMLAFSPCLNASEYAGCGHPDGDRFALIPSIHDQPDSAGRR
jgi:hypothetical protein